jgi:hypothetical protein
LRPAVGDCSKALGDGFLAEFPSTVEALRL